MSDSPLGLHIIHDTVYQYSTPVELAQHLAHLRPVERDDQHLEDFSLTVQPEPVSIKEEVDHFGNVRHLFSLLTPHEALHVRAESHVRLSLRDTPLVPEASPAWETVRDAQHYQAGEPFHPESEFVFPSPFVPLHPELHDYAAASFAPGIPTLAGALDLMHRIHQDFTYASASTEISTPVLEAFNARRGVCQDFAHVMIGCLRALGLPVRYVSGYLLTEPPPGQPRLIGADASHAWVSVYCPKHGWVDLDPTNDVVPGTAHAVVAVGRDYGDVTPLRGVIRGGGAHTLEVGVSVLPLEGA